MVVNNSKAVGKCSHCSGGRCASDYTFGYKKCTLIDGDLKEICIRRIHNVHQVHITLLETPHNRAILERVKTKWKNPPKLWVKWTKNRFKA